MKKIRVEMAYECRGTVFENGSFEYEAEDFVLEDALKQALITEHETEEEAVEYFKGFWDSVEITCIDDIVDESVELEGQLMDEVFMISEEGFCRFFVDGEASVSSLLAAR